MLNRSLINIFFLALFSYGCQSATYTWFSGSIEKAKESAGTKLIMLDFYTPNWGGCLRLDAETFVDRDVISFSKDNFISLKLNANKFPGDSLYAHYQCKGVPSLVFIDKNGEEIDRIVGFREPGDYLNSIKKISSNIETFFSLRNQYFSGEHSVELLSMLANKYDQQSKLDSANILYNKLSTYKLSKEMKYEVEYFKSKYQLSKNNDPSAITNYINTYVDSPYMKKAFLRKISFFRNQENKGFEIKTYIEAISSFPNDYSLLNRYAWRMTELDANLVDALSKSSYAISLIEDEKEKAMVIDTKAEILWKLNRLDEALDEIDKALRIDPENSYYIKQKSKFLNSKSNWILDSI